jgi:hypothetical protein
LWGLRQPRPAELIILAVAVAGAVAGVTCLATGVITI